MVFGLISGLAAGTIISFGNLMKHAERMNFISIRRLINGMIFGLAIGPLMGATVFGLASGLSAGLIFGLVSGRLDNNVYEISMVFGWIGVIFGGIVGGPIVGVAVGLINAIEQDKLDIRKYPNEGTYVSARNALVVGLVGGMGAGLSGVLV